MTTVLNYSTASTPTIARFHRSRALVRGIRGPMGSGKSSGSIMEVLFRGMQQRPSGGVRRTKVAVVRSTFRELKSTTIPDWEQWFDPNRFPVKMTEPPSCHVVQKLSDGTTMDMEVIFLSMDEINDIEKLKSLNITFAWVNEASGIQHFILISTLLSRCGRFPHTNSGGVGPTWYGLIMDTNPPSDRHWWHDKFEKEKPAGWEQFVQPGAVLWDDDDKKWVRNPEAENIANLPVGWAYYENLIASSEYSWIKVFLGGEYGTTLMGKPVYMAFRESEHVAPQIINPDTSRPALFCLDFGLNPALAVMQLNSFGGIEIIDELCPADIDLETFMSEQVNPLRMNKYHGMTVTAVGDPSGGNRSGNDKRSPFMVMKAFGLACVPAIYADNIVARVDATTSFLKRGRGMLVSPHCTTIVEGFRGAYHYKVGNTADMHAAEPTKNHHSHIMNGVEYGCVWVRKGGQIQRVSPTRKARPRHRFA